MAAGEMTPAEVPAAEVPCLRNGRLGSRRSAAEVMEAAEMAAAETSEMTKASEVAPAEAAEVAPAEIRRNDRRQTAEVTATTKSTVPKGKCFAHHARHHARRKRGFEAEPERDRRCENFQPYGESWRSSPLPLRDMTPLRTQPTHGRFRAFHGTLSMA